VIDVGAHVGFYSALAALVNPSARVYSMEPHPGVFARLERTLAVNEATNVRAFQLAAGAATGAGELLEPQSSALPTMSTLSREVAEADARHSVRSIPVRVVRLDDFVAEQGIERVELVKVDTETTEPDVLRGMSATLERDRPEIFCEVLTADGGAEIQGLLAPLGYRSYLLTERGPELRDRVRPRPGADAYPDNYLFTIPGREALSSG
jgi:FkbM family methyltransferase